MNFENGTYNISDINQIIDNTVKENFNITEQPITISVDVNRYAILIIVERRFGITTR